MLHPDCMKHEPVFTHEVSTKEGLLVFYKCHRCGRTYKFKMKGSPR